MTGALDFDCLAFFKEEVQHESAVVKIDAANRLHLIASALGPQKTIEELIPYVAQAVKEEPLCNNEEFLFSLAKQYSVLSDHISGHSELLIAPLEHLAAQEETVIREQAIHSLRQIVAKRHSLVPEYLVPTLHRLATKTDFTARVSACALLPTVYEFASEEQRGALREAYNHLCNDDTPMVKRAAANWMCDLFAVCDKQVVLSDMLNVHKQLSLQDTQDTIRVSCVHATLVISRMLSPEENRQHTVSVIQDAAEDRSWRVRLAVAKIFDQLCEAAGPEVVSADLVAPLVQLMKDNEQEVRREAVQVIERCLKLPSPLGGEFWTGPLLQHLVPQLQALFPGTSVPVRAALSQVLGPVAKVIGRDGTAFHLLGLISNLMKDEAHEVRLSIASHAGLICEVLTVDGLVHSLLNTIQNLMMDNHWRIRQRVVEQTPKLAKLFGVEMFQSKLEAFYLSSFRDSVHSVREAAIQHLKEIVDTFGSQWTSAPRNGSWRTVEHLLPKLVEQYSQSAGYANRLTTLHVLLQVSGVMTPDQCMQFIIPVLIKATKDGVPNVRFAACRNIMWMMENHNLGTVALNTVIKPALMELEQDSDIDVQYYAQRAIAACR